jgi:hypothetical protein
MYVGFVLGVGTSVDGKVLGENIDRLIARATQPVSKNVPGVTVLRAIIIQAS